MKRFAGIALPSVGTVLVVFGWLSRNEHFSTNFPWDFFLEHPGRLIAAFGAAVIVAGLLIRRDRT